MAVQLNIDLGELADEPDELFALAHVANIACGGHAGDDASIDRALERCARLGARVGAHPSYPDRANFGRRSMAVDAHGIRAFVAEQCDRLAARATRAKLVVAFVKAHGALYHDLLRDETVADAVVTGATDALGHALCFIGALPTATRRAGVELWREGFADRGVREDGTLVPRGEPGALITEPTAAAARTRALVLTGDIETICVHGDTPGAVAIARAVRGALDEISSGAT